MLLMLWAVVPLRAKEYHVSVKGKDSNLGTMVQPFRSIAHAASVAVAGDVITVHAGIYREEVSLMRGGESDEKRITYQAAAGENVEIKGSEVIVGWKKVKDGVWKVNLPNAFFGSYNPYTDLIAGDWYFPRARKLHTGAVYLNSKGFEEIDPLEPLTGNTWYCSYEKGTTTIVANFGTADPNKELLEINMRKSCFYPGKTGVNYLTVRGFKMSQAATQWAAPTAEQVGLIGTNWSKGWVIEDNVISDSKCVGLTLGKDRKTGHNGVDYNEMVHRVIAAGWNKDTIGSHLVRNNKIFNCGAAGICGSFGAAFSRIEDNEVYAVYTNRSFYGAEMAGIKLHGAIDVIIAGNKVHHAFIGIWLDWMAQGTIVRDNLCYENDLVDLFMEVNHGPYEVSGNQFLSAYSLRDWSEGGTFSRNLFAGLVSRVPDSRATPYFKPHSTAFLGIKPIQGGDNRFFNNVFMGKRDVEVVQQPRMNVMDGPDRLLGYGLAVYDDAVLPVMAKGNIYLDGAKPFKGENK